MVKNIIKKSKYNLYYMLVLILIWPILLFVILSKIFFAYNIPNKISDFNFDHKLKKAIKDVDNYIITNDLDYIIKNDTLMIIQNYNTIPIAFLNKKIEIYRYEYNTLINNIILLKKHHIMLYYKYKDIIIFKYIFPRSFSASEFRYLMVKKNVNIKIKKFIILDVSKDLVLYKMID